MLLSLQGSMAVGKSTAIDYIQQHAPDIRILPEDNRDIIQKLRLLDLDKTQFEDYVTIQRYWIAHEIERYQLAKDSLYTLVDWGAEEMAYYTLHFPKSIGKDWDIATALAPELTALKACFPERTLFLQTGQETLQERKDSDRTRRRNFFNHYTQHLLPGKLAWLQTQLPVDVLAVDQLSSDQVGQAVLAWCQKHFGLNNQSDQVF
ncbi:hypothetical protein [Streptococcus merionis]|uniref:Thymidylate_kin, Thymidylate kinase n=1 Tax=Streptococcus merionis TaxID=400065 RepID=A0A239SSU4_9STRE|nr:hypothetical protein [Streptococcus merionis]SNU88565.1 Thymidylate_kin, Thymidylate kinase [Streptococcus merionis]